MPRAATGKHHIGRGLQGRKRCHQGGTIDPELAIVPAAARELGEFFQGAGSCALQKAEPFSGPRVNVSSVRLRSLGGRFS